MKIEAILRCITLAIALTISTSIVSNAAATAATQSSRTMEKPALDKVFRDALGEYPYDVKLFDNPTLRQRLIRLLGQQRYDMLVEYFQVETPIEYGDGAYHTFGCQAHNCGFTEFEILYYPEDDNLCIRYRIEDNESIFMDKSTYVSWPNQTL